MKVIRGSNINEVFQIAVMNLRAEETIQMDSRNGEVSMFREPVTSVYERPNERVLFNPIRNCNPFFHFVEGLWMIAGRNELKPLTMFAKKLADYSDDGYTLNGAYGYRWRHWFERLRHVNDAAFELEGVDQLDTAIKMLKASPKDRRVVLGMWDPTDDLGSTSKDIPCNTQVFFKSIPTKDGYILDMTVTNRSNDLIWGAYGANVVHFSMVHEYVASMAGMGLGHYYQVSNNAHVYSDVWKPLEEKLPHGYMSDPYETDNLKPLPLVDDPSTFDEDVNKFFDWLLSNSPPPSFNNKIFVNTAVPMVSAWKLYKEEKDKLAALEEAMHIKAPDWRKACVEWFQRKIYG